MDTENDIKDRLDSHQKAYIAFLSDVLEDRKRDTRFLKVVISVLMSVVLALVAVIAVIGIHTQNKLVEQSERSEKRMYEFLVQYDFTSEIDLDTYSNDNGSGNVTMMR